MFDREGNFLSSWGDGLFEFPHAITVDPEDNVWVVDRNRGQIMKFTPEGDPLMTIGARGHRSDTGIDPTDFSSSGYLKVAQGGGPFNLPAGVDIAPSGDIFIADGYGNCQVHRFSAEGEHLLSWGEPGSGPGQFMLPHGVRVDSRGNVLVADRENDRVQVFSQSGEFIAVWPSQLIGPAALYADAEDVVYVPEHNGGHFSVLSPDGEPLARWGSEENKSCHGVAGDSHGGRLFCPAYRGRAAPPARQVRQEVTMADELSRIVDSEAERLATGFVFTEGPLWHPDGYLLFVDIRAT